MNPRPSGFPVLRPHSLVLLFACLLVARLGAANVTLAPGQSERGYVARLLINEVPFPGERGWESEADSKDAMRQVLLVLDARLNHIPARYTQKQIATVQTDDMITLMTAGGERGQIDGFYLNASGKPTTVPRVQSRIDYLMGIAGKGKPGTFARLLNHAQALSDAYFARRLAERDVFEPLDYVASIPVTGRAYSWMTDVGQFHPGGRYVRIPDQDQGDLGGNRFFTLKDLTK
jgi:hypothetical protein